MFFCRRRNGSTPTAIGRASNPQDTRPRPRKVPRVAERRMVFTVPFDMREVCKGGWLQQKVRTPSKPLKKAECLPAQWSVLCIHDDKIPLLEIYSNERDVVQHKPLRVVDLIDCAYISQGIEDDRTFYVGFNDEQRDNLEYAALNSSERREWIQILTCKLIGLDFLQPSNNLYSPLPTASIQHPLAPPPPPPSRSPRQSVPTIPRPQTSGPLVNLLETPIPLQQDMSRNLPQRGFSQVYEQLHRLSDTNEQPSRSSQLPNSPSADYYEPPRRSHSSSADEENNPTSTPPPPPPARAEQLYEPIAFGLRLEQLSDKDDDNSRPNSSGSGDKACCSREGQSDENVADKTSEDAEDDGPPKCLAPPPIPPRKKSVTPAVRLDAQVPLTPPAKFSPQTSPRSPPNIALYDVLSSPAPSSIAFTPNTPNTVASTSATPNADSDDPSYRCERFQFPASSSGAPPIATYDQLRPLSERLSMNRSSLTRKTLTQPNTDHSGNGNDLPPPLPAKQPLSVVCDENFNSAGASNANTERSSAPNLTETYNTLPKMNANVNLYQKPIGVPVNLEDYRKAVESARMAEAAGIPLPDTPPPVPQSPPPKVPPLPPRNVVADRQMALASARDEFSDRSRVSPPRRSASVVEELAAAEPVVFGGLRKKGSIKEEEIMKLDREISTQCPIRVSVNVADAVNSLAIVEYGGHLWVAGWTQKAHRRLSIGFHIGDEVKSVNGHLITSMREFHRCAANSMPNGIVNFVNRRLPYGQAFAFKRDYDRQDLGIILKDGKNTIVEVKSGFLADRGGLHATGGSFHNSASKTALTISEVNNRPLNLFAKNGEAAQRLTAVGKDISIVVQPSDFVKMLKTQLKNRKNWKDFIVG